MKLKSKLLKYSYYASVLATVGTVGMKYLISKQVISADGGTEFKIESLNVFIADFYPWVITVSISLAVIILIYAGYLMVTSAGNIEQTNKGKEYITGALSGLAFLILAGLIYNSLKI